MRSRGVLVLLWPRACPSSATKQWDRTSLAKGMQMLKLACKDSAAYDAIILELEEADEPSPPAAVHNMTREWIREQDANTTLSVER